MIYINSLDTAANGGREIRCLYAVIYDLYILPFKIAPERNSGMSEQSRGTLTEEKVKKIII